MKQNLLIILLLVLPILSSAQYDSIANELKKEFEAFKNSASKKQVDFINQNDSIFIEFLKESWATVELLRNKTVAPPKPVVQPVSTVSTIPYEFKLIKPIKTPVLQHNKIGKLETKKLPPVNYDSRYIVSSLDFYGTNEKVYYSPQLKPHFYQVSVDNIIEFYTHLSKNSKFWEYNLQQLIDAKAKYKLNDWGYYQLVRSTSKTIFEKANEQNLFCWYVLQKRGYNVKVGYNNDEIFLLIPSVQKLYNIPYLKDAGHSYYILDKPEQNIENIRTYNGSYPDNKKDFSFSLQNYPSFNGEKITHSIDYNGEKILFSFEKEVLDFLNSYPHCELKTYFNNRLSENIFKKLDKLFTPLIAGKKNSEIVNELLHFCQTALEYKTDGNQFGKERYLFAEESLFYPYSDCEDRTILFATLIERYTELSSIALDFPGHVALAVNFQAEVEGTFITYNKKKYVVCDPTYINAKIGMLPNNLKSVEAEIIDFYN